MPAVLEFRRAVKAFAHPVIVDLDLSVGSGEVAAIIGANGSGKSTLLRLAAGLVSPDTGAVRVHGEDPAAHAASRAGIGVLLTEERAWYWRLTGRQNLEFFASLQNLSPGARRARTSELLDRVGLADAGDQTVGTYSSGMRLRLALARALLGSPRLLLLDEPTRSADAAAAADFENLVRAQRADGTAIVLASHRPEEVAALATSVSLLKRGEPARHLDRFDAADLPSLIRAPA